MHRTIIFITALIILVSCGEEAKTPEEQQHATISKFSPIIQGTWISADYAAALENSKSAKTAFDAFDGPAYMRIEPSDITGDTIIVSSSLNNHDSYSFYLFMRQGQDDRSLKTAHTDDKGGYYELSYEIDKDTTLLLKHYADNNDHTSTQRYVKITGPQSSESQPYGVAYVANTVLFAGNYQLTDERDGSVEQIELTPDGLVKGMDAHSTYFVFTDFTGDEETNLDEMLFDERTRTQKGYIFEISGDTTRLYKALENEDRTRLIKGVHTYTLVKQG